MPTWRNPIGEDVQRRPGQTRQRPRSRERGPSTAATVRSAWRRVLADAGEGEGTAERCRDATPCNHLITKTSIRITNLGYSPLRAAPPRARLLDLDATRLLTLWSTRTQHSVNLPPYPVQPRSTAPSRLAAPNFDSVMASLLNSIKSAFVNQAPNLPRYITAAEAVEIDQWLMGGPEKGAFSIDQVRTLARSSPPAATLAHWRLFRTAHGTRRLVGCSSSRGTLPARPAGRSGRERDQAEADKRARLGLLRTGEPGRGWTRGSEAPL